MTFKHFFVIVFFCVIIGRTAFVCYQKPSYNWDTLPYMALILNFEDEDVVRIYQTTYRVAEAEIPEDKFKLMTDTSHVLKKSMLNDPKKFFQYTSFFRVKPLYNALSYLAYKAGARLSMAPVIPSLISYLAISILLFWTFSKLFPSWLAAFLSICISLSPPLLDAARLATPDALSAFIIIIACFLFTRSTGPVLLALVLSASVLVRIDNIIFAVIVMGFQAFIIAEDSVRKKTQYIFWGFVVLWFLLVIIILKFANVQNGFEGFYGGLFKKLNPITILKEAFVGLNTVQTSYLSVMIAICGMVLFYHQKFNFKKLNTQQYLFLILVLYTAIRFVLFPDLSTRFFLPVYCMVAVLAFEATPSLVKKSANC